MRKNLEKKHPEIRILSPHRIYTQQTTHHQRICRIHALQLTSLVPRIWVICVGVLLELPLLQNNSRCQVLNNSQARNYPKTRIHPLPFIVPQCLTTYTTPPLRQMEQIDTNIVKYHRWPTHFLLAQIRQFLNIYNISAHPAHCKKSYRLPLHLASLLEQLKTS